MASAQVLAQLRACLPAPRISPLDLEPVWTGHAELDQLMGKEGWQRGSLVEWFGADSAGEQGSGAGWLALAVAWGVCGRERMLVVLDGDWDRDGPGSRGGRFYPPAAAAMGIDLARMVVLRPRSEQDAIWGLDQALRCRGVGGVWGAWGELDSRVFRRLQLAAEEGEALGMLVRPGTLRGQPSWAHVQLLVESCRDGPIRQELDRENSHRPSFDHPSLDHPSFDDGPSSSAGGGFEGRRWRVEVLRRRYGVMNSS